METIRLSQFDFCTHTHTNAHARTHTFIRSNFFRYMDFDWFIPSSYTCVSSLFTSPIIQHYGSSRYAIVCRLHNALWATTLLYLCWVVFLFFSLFKWTFCFSSYTLHAEVVNARIPHTISFDVAVDVALIYSNHICIRYVRALLTYFYRHKLTHFIAKSVWIFDSKEKFHVSICQVAP